MELVVWIAFMAVEVSLGIIYCVDMTLDRNSCVDYIRRCRGESTPSGVDRVSIGKGNSISSCVDHVRSGGSRPSGVDRECIGKDHTRSSCVDHVRCI